MLKITFFCPHILEVRLTYRLSSLEQMPTYSRQLMFSQYVVQVQRISSGVSIPHGVKKSNTALTYVDFTTERHIKD